MEEINHICKKVSECIGAQTQDPLNILILYLVGIDPCVLHFLLWGLISIQLFMQNTLGHISELLEK
jgi:hypothetical protein